MDTLVLFTLSLLGIILFSFLPHCFRYMLLVSIIFPTKLIYKKNHFFHQVILLEEGWRELFLLGASQWSMPLEIAPILSAAGLHVDTTPPETIVDVMATVRLLQETVNKFKAANVDSTEYACLKAIVLFKPSK